MTGARAPALPVIVVAGPTAGGKTELAVELARRLGGEILSADSRQIYRDLDAGTAKPELDERGRCRGVPFHFVSIADPREAFDAGTFGRLARERSSEIRARGAVPIAAGGTGLYLKAFLQGLSDLPKADPAFRKDLMARAEQTPDPKAWLHRLLAEADPASAREIPMGNIQRVVRALEVRELSGRPFSELRELAPRPEPLAFIAFRIEWPAPVLRERIEARARDMWPRMLEEARSLAERYRGDEPGFQSLGYPEALAAVRGELSPEEGLAKMIKATHAYAKRQRTWFRHQLSAVEISGASARDMAGQALARLEALR